MTLRRSSARSEIPSPCDLDHSQHGNFSTRYKNLKFFMGDSCISQRVCPLKTATAHSAATALPATPLSTIWPLLLRTRMPRLPVMAQIFSCRLLAGVNRDLHVEHA